MPDFTGAGADNMRLAVLSGKGGTGKTLLAVNLAAIAKNTTYIDCDVEEPNGHLFFKPQDVQEQAVTVKIPQVDKERCNGCRKCVEFCNFNALAYPKEKLIVFEEICHSCGGCILVCPEKVLTEKEKIIGQVQKGTSEQVTVYTGILNPGEPSGVPIIKRLFALNKPKTDQKTIIDCPPGSSCIVMESIKDADYCILVAEPTLFGVHNLNMVYELVKLFEKPFGVVLNKCLEEENPAEKFCEDKDITILGRIPFDHELGILNSNAEVAVRSSAKYRAIFSALLEAVEKEVSHETTAHS
jgi:MinD superfamily P-loop ATPase